MPITQGTHGTPQTRIDDWETPPQFFSFLTRSLGVDFSIDLAASDHNAKCDQYFTKEENALSLDLLTLEGSIFCNHPYSLSEDFAAQASEARLRAIKENNEKFYAAYIFPNNTDADWFHDYILEQANIRFVRGRVKYIHPNPPPGFKDRPSGGTMICEFWPGSGDLITSLDWRNAPENPTKKRAKIQTPANGAMAL